MMHQKSRLKTENRFPEPYLNVLGCNCLCLLSGLLQLSELSFEQPLFSNFSYKLYRLMLSFTRIFWFVHSSVPEVYYLPNKTDGSFDKHPFKHFANMAEFTKYVPLSPLSSSPVKTVKCVVLKLHSEQPMNEFASACVRQHYLCLIGF